MAQKKLKLSVFGRKLFTLVILSSLVVAIFFGSVYRLWSIWKGSFLCWTTHTINRFVLPDIFSCRFEHFYSLPMKQKIIACLQNEIRQANFLFFKSDDFYSSLKKQCNVLKRVDCKRMSINMISVSLIGVQPRYVANEQLIIADDRRIYDKRLFTGYPQHTLPSLSLDEQVIAVSELSSPLFLFLERLPNSLWQHFFITYQSSETILLKPKKWLTQAAIVADERSIFHHEKLSKIPAIFYDLIAKKIVTEKNIIANKTDLIFDIRFNKQVVVKIFEKKRVRRGV